LGYVGTTRARKSITVVAEPHQAESLWKDPSIEAAVETRSVFQPPWEDAPSEEEWRKRAEYYRDQFEWTAAAECFREAEADQWAAVSRALANHDDVSEALRAIRRDSVTLSRRQARFLLNNFQGAKDKPVRVWLLRQVGRENEARVLKARHDEEVGNWYSAAQYHQKQRNYERAAQLFIKAEDWEDAACCFGKRDERNWKQVCNSLAEYAEPDAVIKSVRDANSHLSKSCAEFLVDQLDEINNIELQIWLLERAGKDEKAQSLHKKHGTNPVESSSSGSTRGESKPVSQYQKAKEKADLLREFEDDSLIVAATRAEDEKTVRRLLKGGMDVQRRGTSNMTALHVAAWRRHHELTSVLLDAGASPNALDEHMETPLYGAVGQTGGNGLIESRLLAPIVEMLLEAGARPDAYSVLCRTPRNMTSDKAIARLLRQAEVSFYEENPDAEPVESAWPSLSMEAKMYFSTMKIINKRSGDHLPCDKARRIWNK